MASIDRVLRDGRMSLMRSHMHQLAILYSYTVKRESLSGKSVADLLFSNIWQK